MRHYRLKESTSDKIKLAGERETLSQKVCVLYTQSSQRYLSYYTTSHISKVLMADSGDNKVVTPRENEGNFFEDCAHNRV
jgi:hypothetical protein